MHPIVRTALSCSAVVAFVGCASHPPRELISAREAYQDAADGPAHEVAPAELKEAEDALRRAEREFDDDGASRKTRDLAYIAERRAQIATAIAERRQAEKDTERRTQEYTEVADRLRVDTVKELKQTRQELGREEQKVEQERQGRIEAEQQRRIAEEDKKRAEAAAAGARAALAAWAQLVENERGLVITLSSGVIFATGKSEVLPAAQQRLNAVAAFLKTSPERAITVEGHTDNVGPDNFNMALSQARADAVRLYLIGQGVMAEKIRAIGMGEGQPIATNGTNEGRTTNRRVEIILAKLPVP